MAEDEIVVIDIPAPPERNDPPPPASFIIQYFRNPFRDMHEHAMMAIIREQEIGKTMLNLGVVVAIGLMLSTNGVMRTTSGHLVLLAVLLGCGAIYNGIVLRPGFPRAAAVAEVAGILVFLLAFLGLAASILPPALSWLAIIACAIVFAWPHVWDLASN